MEIAIYDVIDGYGGVSARDVREQLAGAPKGEPIVVRINSPGGDVFEGLAIYSMLADRGDRVTVQVDGIAASMASVIAMVGREITMAENAFLMIHNPVNFSFGDADDMRHAAELLDKITNRLAAIYAKRTKQTVDDVLALMRDETWYTADEAVAGGFADRVSDQLAIAAKFNPRRFQKVPAALKASADSISILEPPEANMPTEPNPTEPAAPKAASYDDLAACLPGAEAEFLCAQLKAKATLDQAQSAWMEEQGRRLDAARKEAAEAKATAEAQAKKPGHDSVPDDTPTGEMKADPVAEWRDAVAAKAKAAGCSLHRAAALVNQADPGLRERMLAAVNG